MTYYEQIPHSFHIINEGSRRQSQRTKTKATLNDCVSGEELITSLQVILSKKYTNSVILKHSGKRKRTHGHKSELLKNEIIWEIFIGEGTRGALIENIQYQ